MDLILDPPAHLAPIEQWEEWLATLRTLPPDAEGVAEEIATAERWLPQRIEIEKVWQAQKEARAGTGSMSAAQNRTTQAKGS